MGLVGYASLKVLVNAFYAIDRRKTPMFVSFAAVGLNLLFNWLFTWHLGWGHRGLAFSTACVASTNFIVLYVLMRQELGRFHGRRIAVLDGARGGGLWRDGRGVPGQYPVAAAGLGTVNSGCG